MDSFFTRYKNPLVLIAVVVTQIIALAMQVQRSAQGFNTGTPDGAETSLARRWITATVTPVENIVHGSSLDVRHLWSNYIDLRNARQQDAQLRNEVARLREEEAAFSEDAAQGRRLQKLLNFKQQYVTTTVPAQVIGTSGSDRSRLVLIDKGSADGLKPEEAVITPDGVVGKLRDVFPHSAQVLLISDPTSGAGVILASTRIRGILRGTADGEIQINNLTADSRIKPGEQVVTSGGDLVFPRGIPVGTIQSIVPDPQHQPYTAITIKPAANLTELEEVLIITGTQSTMPVSAQEDAAAAAQLHTDEQTRAADLVAEKLPSLHPDAPDAKPGTDPNAPAGADVAGGLPGIPNSGLPHPKQTLHPDRFTPGDTPPADSLTPGAKSSTVYTPPPRPHPSTVAPSESAPQSDSTPQPTQEPQP